MHVGGPLLGLGIVDDEQIGSWRQRGREIKEHDGEREMREGEIEREREIENNGEARWRGGETEMKKGERGRDGWREGDIEGERGG